MAIIKEWLSKSDPVRGWFEGGHIWVKGGTRRNHWGQSWMDLASQHTWWHTLGGHHSPWHWTCTKARHLLISAGGVFFPTTTTSADHPSYAQLIQSAFQSSSPLCVCVVCVCVRALQNGRKCFFISSAHNEWLSNRSIPIPSPLTVKYLMVSTWEYLVSSWA